MKLPRNGPGGDRDIDDDGTSRIDLTEAPQLDHSAEPQAVKQQGRHEMLIWSEFIVTQASGGALAARDGTEARPQARFELSRVSR